MKNSYCNKCGECCKNIAADFSKNIIYRDGIQPLSQEFSSLLEPGEIKNGITLCKCKYLVDNLCTHPNKPEVCKNFPSFPFAFLPEKCGYYGEMFIIRENFMQKLRKLEEEIIHYEALSKISSKDEAKQYAKIIEKHNNYLNKYRMYY